jgi:N-acetylmuramoyl-L-alanine amidase
VRHPILRTVVAAIAAASVTLAAATPRELYERAMVREAAVRMKLEAARPSAAVLSDARRVAQSYESLALAHPNSGYSDNAFWQAARLTSDVWQLGGEEPDRLRAVRLFKAIVRNYPSSSLVAKAGVEASRLEVAARPAQVAAKPVAPVDRPATLSAPAPRDPAPPVRGADAVVDPDAGAPRQAVASTDAAPPRPQPRRDEPTTRPRAEGDERILKVPDAGPRMTVRDIPAPVAPPVPAAPAVADAEPAGLVKSVTRTKVGAIERVTIELDRELPFHDERIGDPDRVFVDVRGVRVARDAKRTQKFADGFVRQIRVGERPDSTTRIVLDLEETASHSVFTLYNPFRVVIDCERRPYAPPLKASRYRVHLAAAPVAVRGRAVARLLPGPQPAKAQASLLASAALETPVPRVTTAPLPPAPPPPSPPPTGDESLLPGRRTTAPSAAAAPALPSAPSANLQGRFSLSRQLGLGIARIVIDAGHGGHDPGAQVKGLSEAELVLDIALRLEQLLLKQPGVEVVLTRRTDVFIPLEERTAIANREGADLFLSIHANASRNARARGVETYFLNFASNPDAEAVAARENAASGRTMHSLPDIVRAITLNNKLDESRDFASMVQKSMVRRLGTSNKGLRDLGVKQAPFVVLIGASMPSVLAEIAFMTHQKEAQHLRTPAYRQRIAASLFEAVQQYQRSLKSTTTQALQE